MDVVNILTVDVEDYFMVSAFADVAPVSRWKNFESRVVANTKGILDLLDEKGVKATFFVLGYVAERFPELVRDIQGRGHEIGCHSFHHRLIYEMSPEEFRDDTVRAKGLLESITGERVRGYRAPSYSITKASEWAVDVLVEAGFEYDSSIFPIRHDRYGYPGFHRFPVRLPGREGGSLLEIPPSTVRIFGNNIPVGGGGYLRLYPFELTKWSLRRLNDRERQAAVVYFHPWEIDPGQPRLKGGCLTSLRHYTNIGKTRQRISCLLDSFRFGPAQDAIARYPAA
jgi:polysaccharide deacetylase family protein (PEP-CTERM system associated)